MTSETSDPARNKFNVFYVLLIAFGAMIALQMVKRGGGEFRGWYGKPVPDIQVKTLDGKTIRLADLKGRRVVVDIWATWCPPCREEIPHFNQLAADIGEDKLVIIGISNEDESTVREFVKTTPIKYNVACTSDLPAPFSEVTGIPTTFFIDRNGIIDNVAVAYRDLGVLRQSATASDYVPSKS
jgi:peroxiredoxin